MARAQLQSVAQFSSTNQLVLAIGLPFRNREALTNYLRELYLPSSANYRHYLSSTQFAEKYGPTVEDYQAVGAFAQANGLRVVGTHPNRMLLDVAGTAGDIEKAFHLKLRVYQHPRESRTFFAPDVEPSIDLAVSLLHISGLDNYTLPHPKSLRIRRANSEAAARPRAGSGPGGDLMGKDFRAAYAPGVLLTGIGQTVALFALDGFYASDIAAYMRQAGLPNVPVQPVLVNGFNGIPTSRQPGSGNEEVALDIEMAASMAPGLSKILVYETFPVSSGAINDLLNRIATDNLAQQISCSWGFDIDANSQQVFLQYAAQGQSFFLASGDSGAFSGPAVQPSDNPYVTVVGGTTLNTSGSGAWLSETVWSGSGGGISTIYPIPIWQQGINMSVNKGSTAMRNVPDVAMVANNVLCMADLGKSFSVQGTSIAAPLWAGFAALINERAANQGQPPIGFLNPALYRVGRGTNYAKAFHDIAAGNNTSADSPNQFYAVPGLDLCTGWGTPSGSNLIEALLAPSSEALVITPALGFIANGSLGGPFNVTSTSYSLRNEGSASLNWSAATTADWLDVSPGYGTLPPDRSTATVKVSLNSIASNSLLGAFTAELWFTNLNNHAPQSRQFTLLAGNSGFETGDFIDWTFSGDSTTSFAYSIDSSLWRGSSLIQGVDDSRFVHSGLYGAFLGQKGSLGSLSQTISGLPGQLYLLSFWLANPKAGTGNEFRVLWNTNILYDKFNLGAFNWTNLQFLVTAPDKPANLEFGFRNDQNAFALDDITLQPVSAPTLGNLVSDQGLITFTLNSVPGLRYRVQYATDLKAPNWNYLGAGVIAAQNVLTISDYAGQAPQLFYRIVIAP